MLALKRISAIFCLFTGLAWQTVQGQEHNLAVFSIEEGLPQSEVMALLQDSLGFMWFGTRGGGIARYDGVSFKKYGKAEGLGSEVIQFDGLKLDSEGNLWITYGNSFGKFDGKTFYNFSEKDGINIGALSNQIETDAKGGVYFTANTQSERLIYYAPKGSGFRRIDNETMPHSLRRTMFAVNGEVWFSTSKGLFRYENNAFQEIFLGNKTVLKDKVAIPLLFDSEGFLWLKVNDPLSPGRSLLYRYKNNSFDEFHLPQGYAAANVFGIYESPKNGFFWIQFNNPQSSVLRYKKNEFLPLKPPTAVTAAGFTKCFTDYEGNLWIGTGGKGVSRFSGAKFLNFTANSGMPGEIVRAFYEDSLHNIWFGAAAGGIAKYDGKQLISYPDDPSKPVRFVKGFAEMDGKLYASYRNGPASYFNAGKQVFEPATQNKAVWALPTNLFEKDSQGRMWSNDFANIYVTKGSETLRIGTESGFTGGPTSDLLDIGAGTIWLATPGVGIHKYSEGKITAYTKENSGLSENLCLQLAQDRLGRIWIATYGGGVNIFDGKAFTQLTPQKGGLSSYNIYTLVEDDDRNMWVGTQLGLDKFAIDDDGTIRKVKNYRKSDGLVNDEANGNAVYKDSKGRLWFGTIGGASAYQPSEDFPNTIAPKVHISGVRLFFNEVNWGDSVHLDFSDGIMPWLQTPINLELPYNKNHLTFDMVALSLTSPEKVRLQWKLEGLDLDWSPVTDKREAVYANLSPGAYILLVKASNNDGVWSEPTEFSFEIIPPFWKRNWFIASAVLFVLGATYSGYKMRIRSVEAAKEELERIVELRTAEVVRQKDEIEGKQKLILIKNAELEQQKEEILTQNDFINEQNMQITQQNQLYLHQKKEIELKNSNITASINYAKRIQNALLKANDLFFWEFEEHFVFFKPRDLVSGDFYWAYSAKMPNGERRVFVAAADCTGHGVPGALMSMICHSLLNEVVNTGKTHDPADVLTEMDVRLGIMLGQDAEGATVKDGMDIAFCTIDKSRGILEFAGAHNPLLYFQNGEMKTIKGSKRSVGGNDKMVESVFESHTIHFGPADVFYLFSDGFKDQFGGEDGRKLMAKNFSETIAGIQKKPLPEQSIFLNDFLEQWKNGAQQVDDILVIGFRPG